MFMNLIMSVASLFVGFIGIRLFYLDRHSIFVHVDMCIPLQSISFL
jgi:hypothetical protein